MAQNLCSFLVYSFFFFLYFVYAENNESSEVKIGVKIVDADHFNDSVIALNLSLPTVVDSANSGSSPAPSISTTTTPTTTITPNTNLTTTSVSSTTSSTSMTAVPTTTTAPAITTSTTKMPKRKRVPNKRRVCGCDLHLNKCDMNCCCDLDCNAEEKQLFSDCYITDFYEPKVAGYNSHSCFRSNVFYRENSPFLIQETNNGMFCVVSENIENSDQLDSEPKDIDLKYLTNKKPKFSWDFIKKIQHPDLNWEPYKYGSVLLKATGSSDLPNISPFGLPAMLYGRRCGATESVKFLQSMTTFCKHSVENLNSSCTKNPLLSISTFVTKNMAFISNPSVMNLSESLIPVVTAACISKSGIKYCEKSIFHYPTWDQKTSVCNQVLENLELTVIHAGIQGITSVVAKAQFGSYDSKSSPIRQTFSVHFLWRNPPERVEKGEETNSTKFEETPFQKELQEETDINSSDYPRSGNPGYILGKPVPMGTLVETVVTKKGNLSKAEAKENSKDQEESSNPDIDNKEQLPKKHTKLSIALDKNPTRWMTIHNAGLCENTEDDRKNVLFGIGHQTECTLKVTDFATCGNLQNRITDVLLGEASSNFSDKYVPAFGNPDLDNLNEWVQVSISSLPTLGKEGSINTEHSCDGIISSLNIKIAFAYVGPVNYPQAKIVGILYEFGDSFNIPRKLHCHKDKDCMTYHHKVTVTTTVVFFDATLSPTLRIGQWPVVSIKLPQDFFYPFSTTSVSASVRPSFFVMIFFSLLLI